MYKSRKFIRIWMFVLLLGLTAGMVYAEDISINAKKQAISQLTTEDSVTDLASDSSMASDAKNLEDAVESGCDSKTASMKTLGIETLLSANDESMASSRVCGSCSVSICVGQAPGTWCGTGKFCVLSTVCSSQPLTERCVCGTVHF